MGLKNFLARLAGKKFGKKLDLKEDAQMEDKKKWWESKTMWSNILIVIIGVYELVKAHLAQGLPEIPGWLLSFLGGLGVYGRVIADKKIG